MALVHPEPERGRDMALIGLALIVVSAIAVAVPCCKLAVDQLFSLIW